MIGKCLKFDRAKGFGFVVSTDDPTLPDIFVHFSDIERDQVWNRRFLLPGMMVRFDLESDATDADQERLAAKHLHVIPPILIAVQRSAPTTGGLR
jgi:cold shock CspA family protein